MRKKWMIRVVCCCVIIVGIIGYFVIRNQHNQEILDSIVLEFNDTQIFEYGSQVETQDLIKEVSGDIIKQENVDTSVVGQQTLHFVVEKEGKTKEVTYECEVKDTQLPEIILTQEKVTLNNGDKFDALQYIKSVKDKVDGDLTYKKESDVQDTDTHYYTLHSDVKTAKNGNYTVTVKAVDKNHNQSEKKLSVVVEEKKTSSQNNGSSTQSSKKNESSNSQPTYTADKNNRVIVIDPGHQARGNNNKEANGPGSSTMKAKVTTGATGVSSRIAESQINLDVGLKLRQELQARGYTVIMTRTSQNVDMSNQQRAQIGNKNKAAAVIHLHCDSTNSSSAKGAHTIAVSQKNPYCSQLYSSSSSLAKKVISAYSQATGISSRGVVNRDDLTGLNWSEVPSIYLEMGFISNSTEDKNLTSSSFQNKCAKGIANGIDQYFH